MSGYTPTTHEIRAASAIHRAPLIHQQMLGQTIRDSERVALAEFDRWLADVERASAEKALTSAAEAWREHLNGLATDYSCAETFLKQRAKSYRKTKEEHDD